MNPSKEIFTQNLKLLEKRFPSLAKRVRGAEVPPNFSASEGDRGRHLFKEGKLVDSGDPEFLKPSFIGIDDGVFRRPHMMLIQGFGFGCLLFECLKKAKGAAGYYVVVDPDLDSFIYSLYQLNLTPILENHRIRLVIGESALACFPEFINFLRIPEVAFKMRSSQFILHPMSSEFQSDYFETVRLEWESAKKQVWNLYGSVQDSLLGFDIVIRNKEFIEKSPGLNRLKGKFQGVPAIIAASGPSLDKSLPQLKKLQDRALIFCADTSLSILLENGIEPHFVCTIERDGYAKKFLEAACKDRPNIKTNFVLYPFVPNEVHEAYTGPKWVVYRDYGYLQMFEGSLPKGIIPSSSSVAHMCLRAAHYLGCDPVVLIGQDLSLDPENFRSHAKGIASEGWDQPRNLESAQSQVRKDGFGDIFWIEGNLTEKVPTHSLFFGFLKEFSYDVSLIGTQVYNSTEGGAKIPGVEWKSLSDLSKTWEKRPQLFETIRKHHQEFESANLNDLVFIDTYLRDLLEKLNMVKQLLADFAQATLPDAQRAQTAEVLRSAQDEMYKDPRFVCFIVQNAGRELLEIENQWYEFIGNSSEVSEKLQCLRKWNALIIRVVEGLLASIERYGSLPTQGVSKEFQTS